MCLFVFVTVTLEMPISVKQIMKRSKKVTFSTKSPKRFHSNTSVPKSLIRASAYGTVLHPTNSQRKLQAVGMAQYAMYRSLEHLGVPIKRNASINTEYKKVMRRERKLLSRLKEAMGFED